MTPVGWYVATSLEVLRDEIDASAPDRSTASDGSIGDADHQASSSLHNPCGCHSAVCARDFTHDPAAGFDSYAFADWLRKRCRDGLETRVDHVISNRRIASPVDDWVWRDYDGANPHDKHVHVAVDHPASSFDDDSPWEWCEVSAQDVWAWDVDPSSAGSHTASGAVWTTMSRTGYLANDYAPASMSALSSIAADVDTIGDALADVRLAVGEQRAIVDQVSRVMFLLLLLVVLLLAGAGAWAVYAG